MTTFTVLLFSLELFSHLLALYEGRPHSPKVNHLYQFLPDASLMGDSDSQIEAGFQGPAKCSIGFEPKILQF